MLKSILVATFMTTAFTLVSIGTATITVDQAFAGKKEEKEKKKTKKPTIKRIAVTGKRATELLELCLLSNPKPSAPTNSSVTLSCCTDNSEGKRWCVTCFGGTKSRPDNCSVITQARVRYPGSLKPKPGQDQLAPARDKPKKTWPSQMGTFQKAPVTNAPTADKPKKTWPSKTGTMNTVPMKQYKMAPMKQKSN